MEAIAPLEPTITPHAVPALVRIPEATYAEILRHCATARRHKTETVLYALGERDPEGFLVLAVVRPGHPIESAGSAQADYAAAAQALLSYSRDGYRLLGELHRHPDGFFGPSGTDLHTLTSIDADLFPHYLCLVATHDDRRGLVITAHTADPDGYVQEHQVAIMPDASIRSRLFYQPLIPRDRQDATIIIVGLGTLGCQLNQHAAKLNVKRIELVDHDRLERRNLQRHLATKRDVGKFKTTWGKRFQKLHGTSAVIGTHQREITPANRPWMTALAMTSDVIVDATGHPIANHLLSEIGRETGKPVISAGVFAKGSGGFVLRQDAAPTSPCYACLHHLTRRAASDDTATMDQLIHQYGFTPEELAAHVGLFTDANLIAAFLAKALLDLLRRDPLPTDPNLWIIDNALATVTSHRFRQNPTCPSCHPDTEEDDDATIETPEVKGEPS